MNTFYFAVAAAISVASIANGQATREPNCNYERCALGLAPVWNGLAITRGEEQRKVAVLGFFWPGDVSRVFEDDREATQAAEDAMSIRQIGAILTDAGIVMATTGVARALFRRDWDKVATGLAVAGGVSLGASVPFQFGADGYLSRAVWFFNRRYSK
jgi:hypothetical protein